MGLEQGRLVKVARSVVDTSGMSAVSSSAERPQSEAIDAAVRAETLRFVKASRIVGVLGNIGAAAVYLGLARTLIETTHLTVWFITMLGLAGAMGVVALRLSATSRADRQGVPYASKAVHFAVGVCWGSTFFLPGQAGANPEVVFLTNAALVFAVSAGAMGGVRASSLSANLLAPLWSLASIATALDGSLIVTAGLLFFLLLMIRDLRLTNAIFTEVVGLRVQSQHAASAARGLAMRDQLTGLPNRVGLSAAAERILAGDTQVITALFVDLDHFKEVNDRFGHQSGDRVLSVVAERLRNVVRATDVVCRLGGDEFFLLLPGALSDRDLQKITNSIIVAVERPIIVAGDRAFVSASVGVTTAHAAEFDLERAYAEADFALYRAKDLGRRRAVPFSSVEDQRFDAERGAGVALREAIAEQRIEPFCQPVVDLETGEVVGIELLARWPRTNGDFTPPDVFIPMAESLGLIGDLTRFMFAEAADAIEAWSGDPELAALNVSVNVSPLYLADGTLLEDLHTAFGPNWLRNQRVWLEVTENHPLENQPEIVAQLRDANELGVGIAVDDFGTGYTSVPALLMLPIDAVKLDRWLTGDVLSDGYKGEVAAAVFALAETVGKRIVAEGVETVEQAEALRARGVRFGQGWLFGRAVPMADLPELVSEVMLISRSRAAQSSTAEADTAAV